MQLLLLTWFISPDKDRRQSPYFFLGYCSLGNCNNFVTFEHVLQKQYMKFNNICQYIIQLVTFSLSAKKNTNKLYPELPNDYVGKY